METAPLPPVIAETLPAVVGALERRGYHPVLVGALAAWAWGHARTTGDLDMVIIVERGAELEVRDALLALGWPVSDLEANDFGRRFKVDAPRIPVEVFVVPPLELQRREAQRAVAVRFGPAEFRVLSKEDFILRKLVNLKVRTDPNDRLDILAVVTRWHRELDVDYVMRHCGVQRVCGEFQAYLERARQAGGG